MCTFWRLCFLRTKSSSRWGFSGPRPYRVSWVTQTRATPSLRVFKRTQTKNRLSWRNLRLVTYVLYSYILGTSHGVIAEPG
ncbi:hypothetical protein BDN72DRAFT_616060 [Pluteus cervinus]|uniref:Uncharacterized protein n=1 Tax=Pluteus cervinus TaxID=181527 RepID=A0ACD3AUE1_9AGAR|nr:hypothetical protein BDN72DRAFT_616060 [Pluteus cervinus]